MADYPNRMNKSMMNSPYYASYSQGRESRPITPSNQAIRMPGLTCQTSPSTNVKKTKKPAPAPVLTRKQAKKLEKQRRREKDYFFVMRKGVCFLMFLICLVVLVVSSTSVVMSFLPEDMLPDTIKAPINQFTAIYAIPDNTPIEDRVETLDKDGEPMLYADQSIYIGLADILYGAINSLLDGKIELSFTKDADGNSLSPFFDDINTKLALIADSSDVEDPMLSIADIMVKYSPLLILILIITALIVMIKAFFGMFGKRIFKRFGLAAIFMIIVAVPILLSGLSSLGVLMGNPTVLEDSTVASVMDFNNLMPFITRMITGAPLVAIDPAVDVAPPVLASGFGLLIMGVSAVLMLILSLFARRKVPYSIFDR